MALPGKTIGFFACLVVAIAWSGVALTEAAQKKRSLYQALDHLQIEQNTLLAEYSRLLLERSTLASLQTIESVAQAELNMVVPSEVARVGQ